MTNYSNFTSKMGHDLDMNQIDLFNCLLAWIAKNRLFIEKKSDEEAWEISDLRKIVHQLCQATLDMKSTKY